MNRVYCCYPGGKHKALTMSYDDGKKQDRRLVEIFNRYGIRGTFNLNSGLWDRDENRIKPEEIRTLYQGHEIACHTVTHPTIARCPLPEVAEETLADRRELEKLTGYPVRGLAYPNGSLSREIEEMLPACGIRYGRVVGNTDSFALPENPYRWMATCHHNHRLMELGEQFLGLFKKQYLYLMYVWGHSYEFDDRNNWDLMEDFCRMMGGKDDIWYCTNIEFMDCMDDFARLRFAADNSFVYNPNARDCWISVNDQAPVCIPGGATVQL
ncbi:MAG: polysaccharide deacetylase family protein [Clostridia bacterium]|nr:polysaccharide deacetylase family protein [Clostridia bacterium]